MLTQAANYAPGNTDLAWTRLTPWRALLAAALDQYPPKVTAASVIGRAGQPERRPAGRLARGPAQGDGRSVRTSKGPGITAVVLRAPEGAITITDRTACWRLCSSPGHPRPAGRAEARDAGRAARRGAAAARPGRRVRGHRASRLPKAGTESARGRVEVPRATPLPWPPSVGARELLTAAGRPCRSAGRGRAWGSPAARSPTKLHRELARLPPGSERRLDPGRSLVGRRALRRPGHDDRNEGRRGRPCSTRVGPDQRAPDAEPPTSATTPEMAAAAYQPAGRGRDHGGGDVRRRDARRRPRRSRRLAVPRAPGAVRRATGRGRRRLPQAAADRITMTIPRPAPSREVWFVVRRGEGRGGCPGSLRRRRRTTSPPRARAVRDAPSGCSTRPPRRRCRRRPPHWLASEVWLVRRAAPPGRRIKNPWAVDACRRPRATLEDDLAGLARRAAAAAPRRGSPWPRRRSGAPSRRPGASCTARSSAAAAGCRSRGWPGGRSAGSPRCPGSAASTANIGAARARARRSR